MFLLFIPIGILVDISEKIDKFKEHELSLVEILEYYSDTNCYQRAYEMQSSNDWEKLGNFLDTLNNHFDKLISTRRNQLEKPMGKILDLQLGQKENNSEIKA